MAMDNPDVRSISCPECYHLQRKIDEMQKQHTTDYLLLKKRIISTSTLIKKYKISEEEKNAIKNQCDKLKNLLQQLQGECQSYERTLADNLKKIDPLKKENKLLKSTNENVNERINLLHNDQAGNKKLIEQLQACIKESKHDAKKFEDELKFLNEKLRLNNTAKNKKMSKYEKMIPTFAKYMQKSSKILNRQGLTLKNRKLSALLSSLKKLLKDEEFDEISDSDTSSEEDEFHNKTNQVVMSLETQFSPEKPKYFHTAAKKTNRGKKSQVKVIQSIADKIDEPIGTIDSSSNSDTESFQNESRAVTNSLRSEKEEPIAMPVNQSLDCHISERKSIIGNIGNIESLSDSDVDKSEKQEHIIQDKHEITVKNDGNREFASIEDSSPIKNVEQPVSVMSVFADAVEEISGKIEPTVSFVKKQLKVNVEEIPIYIEDTKVDENNLITPFDNDDSRVKVDQNFDNISKVNQDCVGFVAETNENAGASKSAGNGSEESVNNIILSQVNVTKTIEKSGFKNVDEDVFNDKNSGALSHEKKISSYVKPDEKSIDNKNNEALSENVNILESGVKDLDDDVFKNENPKIIPVEPKKNADFSEPNEKDDKSKEVLSETKKNGDVAKIIENSVDNYYNKALSQNVNIQVINEEIEIKHLVDDIVKNENPKVIPGVKKEADISEPNKKDDKSSEVLSETKSNEDIQKINEKGVKEGIDKRKVSPQSKKRKKKSSKSVSNPSEQGSKMGKASTSTEVKETLSEGIAGKWNCQLKRSARLRSIASAPSWCQNLQPVARSSKTESTRVKLLTKKVNANDILRIMELPNHFDRPISPILSDYEMGDASIGATNVKAGEEISNKDIFGDSSDDDGGSGPEIERNFRRQSSSGFDVPEG